MDNPRSCAFLRAQFQVKKIGFQLENSSVITTAQCGRQQELYIFYRLLWVIWWLVILILDLYDAITSGDSKWLFYLTTLGYILIMFNSGLQLTAAVLHLVHEKKASLLAKTPTFNQIVWIIYELSCAAALGLSVMYWLAIYDGAITFLGVNIHVINAVYVLVDVFITAIPVRILHVYLGIIFAILYTLLSLVYQLGAGLEAVYTIVDFHGNPGQAVGISVASIALISGSHLLMFFLYWLRLVIYSYTCQMSQYEDTLHLPRGGNPGNAPGETAVLTMEEKPTQYTSEQISIQ